MVRGKPGAWDAQVCLAWGDSVLSWLRTELSRDSDSNSAGREREEDGEESGPNVWRMTFTPGEGMRLAKLDEEDVRDVAGHVDEDRVGFLPRWFLENEEAYKAANGEATGGPVGEAAAEGPVDGEATTGSVEGEEGDAVFDSAPPPPPPPPAARSATGSNWKI